MDAHGADTATVYDKLQRASFRRSSKATSASFAEPRLMTGEAIARFLADKRYAAIATTRRDGTPHATMTGFFADGATFWFPVVGGTARDRNIRARPYASVVVTEGEGDEHTAVIAEGPAAVVRELPPEVLERWVTRSGEPGDWVEAWVRLDAARLFSFAAERSKYAGEAPAT